MVSIIERFVEQFEKGHLSRRAFIGGLATVLHAASSKTANAANIQESLFQAVAVNHVALRVSDVKRSEEFYKRVPGLQGSGSSSSSFLYCGSDFVALFKGNTPGLDHFAFSVNGFERDAARETLREAGIEPIIEGSRTYFNDPDGIELQIEAPR